MNVKIICRGERLPLGLIASAWGGTRLGEKTYEETSLKAWWHFLQSRGLVDAWRSWKLWCWGWYIPWPSAGGISDQIEKLRKISPELQLIFVDSQLRSKIEKKFSELQLIFVERHDCSSAKTEPLWLPLVPGQTRETAYLCHIDLYIVIYEVDWIFSWFLHKTSWQFACSGGGK